MQRPAGPCLLGTGGKGSNHIFLIDFLRHFQMLNLLKGLRLEYISLVQRAACSSLGQCFLQIAPKRRLTVRLVAFDIFEQG